MIRQEIEIRETFFLKIWCRFTRVPPFMYNVSVQGSPRTGNVSTLCSPPTDIGGLRALRLHGSGPHGVQPRPAFRLIPQKRGVNRHERRLHRLACAYTSGDGELLGSALRINAAWMHQIFHYEVITVSNSMLRMYRCIAPCDTALNA